MTFLTSMIDYFFNRRITGLEYYVNEKGEDMFSISLVRHSKGGMKLVSSVRDISLDKVSGYISSSVPVVLGVPGKFILTKVVENLNNETDEVLLNRVIPNALVKDFYIQKTILADGLISLSISRKDFIDSVLKKLSEFNIRIIHLLLGADHLPLFLSIANYQSDNSTVKVPGYALTFINNSISEITISTNENVLSDFSFEDKNVNALNLFSFALSFRRYFGDDISEPNVSVVVEEKRDFRFSSGIRKGAAIFGIGLIIMLILNQVLFVYQSKNASEMKNKIVLNESSLNEFNEIKKKYHEKEQLFTSSGLTIASYTSVFIDQLSEKIPSSIVLSSINVQPYKVDKTQEQERIHFDSKKIIIEGFCSKTPELSEWIIIIKKNKWVKDVLLNNINNDPEINNNRFSLDISIK